MQTIADYLKAQNSRIESRLNQLIPSFSSPYSHLFDAARYSLLSGGKRLRPILTLATVETLGGNEEKTLTAACALELVHTYSLIHDDLPCMDNDDFRRGKPTLHKVYNDGHAVLTGDYLLTYAFEVLASEEHLTSDQKVTLISILSKRVGSEGMLGGQVMDIAFEGKSFSLEAIKLLHRCKTGALITASVEFGGVLAGVSKEKMETIRHFGEHLGLAFQIVDDILDSVTDAANQKPSFVSLLGKKGAQDAAKSHYEQAINAIQSLPMRTTRLLDLADFVINRHN